MTNILTPRPALTLEKLSRISQIEWGYPYFSESQKCEDNSDSSYQEYKIERKVNTEARGWIRCLRGVNISGIKKGVLNINQNNQWKEMNFSFSANASRFTQTSSTKLTFIGAFRFLVCLKEKLQYFYGCDISDIWKIYA